MTRQISTAIETATRQKHGPLSDDVSFSRPVVGEDDGYRQIADLLPTLAVSDPADRVISAERILALQAHVDDVLSDLGTEVLRICVRRRWPTPRNLPDMLEPTAPPQGGLGRTASTTAPTPSAGGPPASSH